MTFVKGNENNDPDLASQLGAVAWSYDPRFAGFSSVLSSGAVHLSTVSLSSGTIITNIGIGINAVASGLTQGFVGIYDCITNLLLAGSNNTTSIGNTIGFQTTPLNTPYTILESGLFYLAILTVGTTPPALLRVGTTNQFQFQFGNGFLAGAGATGQTSLPNLIAPSLSGAGSHAFFMYVN